MTTRTYEMSEEWLADYKMLSDIVCDDGNDTSKLMNYTRNLLTIVLCWQLRVGTVVVLTPDEIKILENNGWVGGYENTLDTLFPESKKKLLELLLVKIDLQKELKAGP